MTKQDRLDALLAERDLGSVWFARPNSFAWLTGASNVVDRETDVGVAAVGYDGEALEVVTNNVEADRLREEELDDVRAHVVEFPWHEKSLAEAVAERAPGPAGADFDAPGLASVDASPLRHPLTPEDIEAYRDLGGETAEAVEAVCRELRPGDTESEVASALRVALSARGIEAPVALVGGAERARKYRHYTPTDAELGGYALVSVTAERGGLHASATRTVAFESELSDEALAELRERHRAARTVEVAALAATREAAGRGGTAGEVFAAVRNAYDRVGHPDEWRLHHQGGAAGYAGREWVATPDSAAPVTAPMAYAWNPTVQGAKSEDTVLVAEEEFGVLTDTGRWPTTAVESEDGGVELECPDVLVNSA
ncbi:M24 family metallopeptidase [Halorussus salilacus]|uniref:M24 family metallopeptidase n=1 Tax=Halorussus salilacus TaxID=2953750 RepID=UPI00209D5369|nr:M24 family metallopeptidase [Halorussus salilacus]USZ67690.1 M24 family metallopeptidase [Halorussus salilacus]